MARVRLTADASEESGSYEPIPEGEYVLKCVKVTDKTTSTNRTMANLELDVDEGPFRGRKVWTNVTMIPAKQPGHGLLVQALKAFGLEHDGELDFDTEEFRNKSCRAKVVIETYVDKDGNTKKKNAIPTAGFITEGEKPARTAKPAAAPAPVAKAAPKSRVNEEVPF